MTYKPINYESIENADIRDIFRRCDWFLRDVYGMFGLPPTDRPDAGAGNWSIALVLLCLIDGLSKYIYPIQPTGKMHHRKRFETLVSEKLLTGIESDDCKEKMAASIYNEFRGLLVHDLAVDRAELVRRDGMEEPAVSKWEPFPEDERNMKWIEERIGTDYAWPVFTVKPYGENQREVLSCAALYGALRAAVIAMAGDSSVIVDAASAYPNLIIQATSDYDGNS